MTAPVFTDGVTPLNAATLNALGTEVNTKLAAPAVVNGKWVKGVGGAAVWAAITPSDIAGYPADGTMALFGDGSWKVPAASGGFKAVYRKTTAKAVVNTVAETDLLNGEITLAAGVLGTTGVARLTAWGTWFNNNVTTAPPQFKLKLGATTLIDTAMWGSSNAWAVGAVRVTWKIVVEIGNLGAANAQEAAMLLNGIAPGPAGGTPAAVAFPVGVGTWVFLTNGSTLNPVGLQGYNTSAVDTTAAQALALTATNKVANALLDVTLTGALVEII